MKVEDILKLAQYAAGIFMLLDNAGVSLGAVSEIIERRKANGDTGPWSAEDEATIAAALAESGKYADDEIEALRKRETQV